MSETRRSPLGRITFGALALGTATLTLTGCGLPLLPPAFQNTDETVAPEPVDTETPTDVVELTEPEDTPEPAGPEDTDVFAIYVGDCVNEFGEEGPSEFSEAPTISCSEPHDYEVYHAEDVQETGLYPGFDRISEIATEICYDEFADFVGTSYEESGLDFTSWFPTEDGWNEGADREVLCLIYDPAGQATGTLEGSRI